MRRSVPPVFTLAAALALAAGVGLRAQSPQAAPPASQTPRPAQPGERAQPPGRDSYRGPQGFSVVLVVADLQSSTAPDDVPPAAKRALADMKEFLPYKSYKLVDAAWILGQAGNNTTRLRGPEEQDYEVTLSTSRGESGRVSVRFALRDAGLAETVADRGSSGDRGREAERERIEADLQRLRQKIAEAERAGQGDQVRSLKAQLEAVERRRRSSEGFEYSAKYSRVNRTIIDTSFSMDVGETVVVGTSRLKSNSKALIALLTAVPAKGSRVSTEVR